MKKALIGAFIGAILVFGWQAASHMFIPYHSPAYKQVANQENVIQTLSTIFKEEGQYLIPRADPGLSSEETAKFDEGMKGKPWALITYHPVDNSDMGMSALRSFTTAFLSVLIFIWLIGVNHSSFLKVFLKSIGIAVFVFAFVYYNSNIWLQTPWEVIRPELFDLLIEWSLCGVWLGYWLTRKKLNKH